MLTLRPQRLVRLRPAAVAGEPSHNPLLQADLGDGVKRHPYPFYEELREHPVAWSPGFFGGGWLLSRHADVSAALKDPRLSAQRTSGWVNSSGVQARRSLGLLRSELAQALLFMDAPDHTRLRARLRQAFGDAFGQGWIAQTRRIVAQQLPLLMAHATQDGAGFDWVSAVANRLPAQVMMGLLGVEWASEEAFVRWSQDIVAFIDNPSPDMDTSGRAQASLSELNDFFRQVLVRQRARPGEDIIGTLLKQGADDADMNTLAIQSAMLLFAGFETTRNLLGNGLWLLLSHPEQWQAVQQEPARVSAAVRECLRMESPVQLTARRVSQSFEMAGRELRRGDLVIALIGSANRDARVFAQPDTFNIHRPSAAHLAFGQGAHVCIGVALTTVEAEMVFGYLAEHHPSLRLGQTAPAWRANMVYRGLTHLRVEQGV